MLHISEMCYTSTKICSQDEDNYDSLCRLKLNICLIRYAIHPSMFKYGNIQSERDTSYYSYQDCVLNLLHRKF